MTGKFKFPGKSDTLVDERNLQLINAMDFRAIKCTIDYDKLMKQIGDPILRRQIVREYIACMNKFYSGNRCGVLCGSKRSKQERDLINDNYRLGKAAMVKVNEELYQLEIMANTPDENKLNFKEYLMSFENAIYRAREIRKYYTKTPKYGGSEFAVIIVIAVIILIIITYFTKSHFAVKVQPPDNQVIAPVNTAQWMLDPSHFWKRSGYNF